ncbi:hypothetical protein [Streptomyces sp. NRRL S-813]|uniref:hypothetical protein n=1 Tax=Streptomyces sp. NRRL S-813 TaxID=1463919 RepID=UPI000A844F6C|nr:hypothetical protein [Streptomyces sp. NRRL S-813]
MPKSTPTTPPLDREAKRRVAVIRHGEEVSGTTPNQATAIQFLDCVIQRLPCQVEVIQT